MEEPGMASRFREYSGLLIVCRRAALSLLFLASLSLPAPSFAESWPADPLSLILGQSPETPSVGGPLELVLLVSHPVPSEIGVRAPVFPSSLRLERVKTSPRAMPGFSGGEERWTAIEYVFTILDPGPIEIGSFTVSVQGRSAESGPLAIVAAGPSAIGPRASLFWEGAPASSRAGESFELRLRLAGIEAADSLRPEVSVPEGAIFQAVPASPQERSAGLLGRYRVTALETGMLRLPTASLRLGDGTVLSSAARAVSIVPGADGRSGETSQTLPARSSSARPASEPAGADESMPRFPDPGAWRLPFLDAFLDPVFAASRGLWVSGDALGALGALRAAERDFVLGPAFRDIRREAERALGLSPGHDEAYAPRMPLWIVIALSAAGSLAAGCSLLYGRIRGNTASFARRRLLALACVFAAAAGLAGARLLYASYRAERSVVLAACVSRRVPDDGSARSAEFSTGQAAFVVERVRVGQIDWLYIEIADGRSGWIEASFARRY